MDYGYVHEGKFIHTNLSLLIKVGTKYIKMVNYKDRRLDFMDLVKRK